ncbi:Hypothetical predicted protein [Pelobates cultripes]|uniref:Protein FAM204A n=2 Tax=Pelobates cultripes TaxID=61616 RepID=A0AAD1WPX4_PELCU|nr:Hypothetical predicted protein [Pelobates cultripes]
MELQKKRLELKAQASRMEKRKSLRKRKHKEKTTGNQEMNNSPAPAKNSALDTLQPYFEASDRFEPPVCIKIIKKSRLEDAMDQAVKGGDIETAEELSDRLATREMAVKVTKAVSSYKYLQTKEKEEASQGSRQKKKNLGWGFEAKKRWETKSNMGYM